MLSDSVKSKRLDEMRKQEIMSTVTATADYGRLRGCDLVVEAVFEDPELKAGVTAQAEAVIPADAIFASNTSTLPISELARASQRPDRFIGIHFFSPVEKMMLVEIIKGRETGPEAVAKALDFVRQIRKTPIVVNDARFFYANRCIIPYINEGLIMVTEGVKPALIENAARQLGMPIGPLQLTDETSLELGWKIAQATRRPWATPMRERPPTTCWRKWSSAASGSVARTGPACTPMTRRASGSASGRAWARSGRWPSPSPRCTRCRTG